MAATAMAAAAVAMGEAIVMEEAVEAVEAVAVVPEAEAVGVGCTGLRVTLMTPFRVLRRHRART